MVCPLGGWGVTFSTPVRPFSNHIGRNGSVSFVVDGSGDLHLFFGQRIAGGFDGTTDLHGMWHSVWLDGNWGPVRPVVSGPPSPSFDPYDASAVVSQGNVLLLTWRTDPGREIRSTFYAYHLLDAPEAPLTPLPAPLAAPLVVQAGAGQPIEQPGEPPAVTGAAAGEDAAVAETLESVDAGAVVDPAAEAGLMPFSREPANAAAAGPAVPLVGALIPTLLFIAAALLWGGVRRRR